MKPRTKRDDSASEHTEGTKSSDNKDGKALRIRPIKIISVAVPIIGVTEYVQNRFSEKAKEKMASQMEAGGTARGKKKDRPPRDFDADFREATHRDAAGRCGIPAGAFRSAMIDVCRAIGWQMTHAKIALRVLHDSRDEKDGTTLILIDSEPIRYDAAVRNATGATDIRARPMWGAGWTATVKIEFDSEMLSLEDVINLLDRAGAQIGIGAGRPFSRESHGCGFGMFRVDFSRELQSSDK